MNKPIGGFFELETEIGPDRVMSKTVQPSFSGIVTHSGRASLRAILAYLRPERLVIPDLCCPVIPELLEIMGIPYRITTVNEDLLTDFNLTYNETLLQIPYFFVDPTVDAHFFHKEHFYKEKVIFDSTQVLTHNARLHSWSFNSFRKWFGVPDGSLLMPPLGTSFGIPHDYATVSTEHLFRNYGEPKKLAEFRKNEEAISSDYLSCSAFTDREMLNIDFSILGTRIENFKSIHKILAPYNTLEVLKQLPQLYHPPFCYPFLPEVKVEKKRFWEKDIFIPTYWEGSPCGEGSFAKKLVDNLLPLPVDHRLDQNDLERMCEEVLNAVRR